MQIKTKTVSCHTAYSKPVKLEVNGTVVLLPLVFPGLVVQRKEATKDLISILNEMKTST